jgi:hypothetical protein
MKVPSPWPPMTKKDVVCGKGVIEEVGEKLSHIERNPCAYPIPEGQPKGSW